MPFYLTAIFPNNNGSPVWHSFPEQPSEPGKEDFYPLLKQLFVVVPCAIVKVVRGSSMDNPSSKLTLHPFLHSSAHQIMY